MTQLSRKQVKAISIPLMLWIFSSIFVIYHKNMNAIGTPKNSALIEPVPEEHYDDFMKRVTSMDYYKQKIIRG